MKKSTEDIVNILNYKYEVFESSVREIIENRYSELYKEGKKKGFYPLIVVPSDVLYDALSVNLELSSTKEFIKFSEDIDVEKFFNSKRSYYDFMQEYQVPLGDFSLETANDYLNEYIDSDTSHPFEEMTWAFGITLGKVFIIKFMFAHAPYCSSSNSSPANKGTEFGSRFRSFSIFSYVFLTFSGQSVSPLFDSP